MKCCICGKRFDDVEDFDIDECDSCGGGIVNDDDCFDFDFD